MAGCLYGAALSKAVREELKKSSIERVSVSIEKFAGGQTLVVKFKTAEKDFVPFADYERNKLGCIDFGQFSGRLLHEGEVLYQGNWLAISSLSELPEDERLAVYRECYTEHYKSLTRGDVPLNVNTMDRDTDILSEEFTKKFGKVKEIVSSFNRNNSDAKSDYVDVGFHVDYRLVNQG